MAGPSFDPNGAVRFDLRSGTATDAQGARLVLVPSAALGALDDDVLGRIGAEIGRACGARVAEALGGASGVRGASLEAVVSHLAGELATMGTLALRLERWGQAMIAVVDNPSVDRAAFLEALLAGAIGAASGTSVFVASLGPSGDTVRLFVGSQSTSARVRTLKGAGRSYAEIIAKLQESAS